MEEHISFCLFVIVFVGSSASALMRAFYKSVGGLS